MEGKKSEEIRVKSKLNVKSLSYKWNLNVSKNWGTSVRVHLFERRNLVKWEGLLKTISWQLMDYYVSLSTIRQILTGLNVILCNYTQKMIGISKNKLKMGQV